MSELKRIKQAYRDEIKIERIQRQADKTCSKCEGTGERFVYYHETVECEPCKCVSTKTSTRQDPEK